MLLFVLLFLIFTLASVRSDWASNIEAATNPDDLIEPGILFNENSKILLTEKFIRIEFLVPFLTYEFTTKLDIDKMIQQLSFVWETLSFFPWKSQAILSRRPQDLMSIGCYIRLIMKFQQRI